MNLLGEHKLDLSSGECVLRCKMSSVYRAGQEFGMDDLLDIIAGVERMNIGLIYSIAANASDDPEITAEMLMDEDINFSELTLYITNQIVALLAEKKKKANQSKTKSKKK